MSRADSGHPAFVVAVQLVIDQSVSHPVPIPHTLLSSWRPSRCFPDGKPMALHPQLPPSATNKKEAVRHPPLHQPRTRYSETPSGFTIPSPPVARAPTGLSACPRPAAGYSFIDMRATASFTLRMFSILLSQHAWLKSTGYCSGLSVRLYSSQNKRKLSFAYA
ncbi:hypothetical protein EP10_002531 [Geobacillus icigianus]|uniref:Uncharacterized protein n=1 Tax=Geobacillus icigianus TaxID=1430331 RepID=A0ABU6BIE6_9BACL|nr:hypothetical protein [Geobacillus icigianus]